VARASIFANSAALLITIYYKVTNKPLSGIEVIGTIIGFLGLLTAVLGSHFFGGAESSEGASTLYIGDLLSLGSALSTAFYILNAGKARANVSVFLYTTLNTVILTIGLSTISIFSESTQFDTSVDGLFGWTRGQFFLTVAMLSVIAGVIGFNLYSFSVKYVPALGYSLVGLCDPLVSTTYAWIIGVGGIPGVFTFAGGAVTIFGIVILLIGQDRRRKREQQIENKSEKVTLVTDEEEHFDNKNNTTDRDSVK